MIAAVLLAAGSARRFDGRQKLLAMVQTRDGPVALVRHSVAGLLAAGLPNVIVVTGRDDDQVRRVLNGMDVRFVLNPDYASGLSTSLKKGLSEAMRLWPNAEDFLVALGDQPLTGTGIIETLLSVDRTPDERRRHPILVPRFRGEFGNPVLFARELAPELLEVVGDRGARAIVERDPSRVRCVDFDRAMPLDVDTASDLAALTDVHQE